MNKVHIIINLIYKNMIIHNAHSDKTINIQTYLNNSLDCHLIVTHVFYLRVFYPFL